MTVFIDTSALFALLDMRDAKHRLATQIWEELRDADTRLLTSNYVVVEIVSLSQKRLGVAAARMFMDNISPLLQVEWVSKELHDTAIQSLLLAVRRDLSLVDCTSFELMRRYSIQTAFTFDKHFQEYGFKSLP